MAGDWIKMREDLHEDPAVLAIARKHQTRPEHVVGYCHKFWAWVSRNTSDGFVTNVHPEDVEGVLNLPGFLQDLIEVGWLEHHFDGEKSVLCIPKFDIHLSESAKKRAFDARRKKQSRTDKEFTECPQNVRKMSAKCPTKSVTREEKRREEKSNKNPPTPQQGESAPEPNEEAFTEFWNQYPSRNGRKIGKAESRRWFLKLKVEEIPMVLKAVRNYAASQDVRQGVGIRDPVRFLRPKGKDPPYWREWLEAAVEKPMSQRVREARERESSRV